LTRREVRDAGFFDDCAISQRHREERQYRSPTKRPRRSAGHQSRTDSRHATKARGRRDYSPEDSSSSGSRPGSRDRRGSHGASGDGHGRRPTDDLERPVRDDAGQRSTTGNGNGRDPPDDSARRGLAGNPGPRDDGPDPSLTPAIVAARAASARIVGSNLKYDGTTCLEAYLARFKEYTAYLNWDETDQFYNLSVNLHDAAAQILWDTNRPRTFDGMVQLLRNRFGSTGQ